MMNKRKLFTLAMTLCMVAILAVGGTLAYFTAEDDMTNVFTAGEVKIVLDEESVKQDANGDYVKDDSKDRTGDGQTYDLHPGITVLKDPTIHVDLEGLEAYVAAKITFTGADLDSLIPKKFWNAPYLDLKVNDLITGGYACETSSSGSSVTIAGKKLEDTANCYIHQDVSKADKDEWVFYVFMKEAVKTDGDIVLFDEINVPTTYGNDEMAKLEDLKIEIEAFATQTDTFSDEGNYACIKAMTAAFPTEFDF